MKAYFHLPGLFEFYDFYKEFLPLFFSHKEFFYDYAKIGSIYGAPEDCLWGGGRTSNGNANVEEVLALMKQYNISSRLTFSNSLLKEEHLLDYKCNHLCSFFDDKDIKNGIIVYSDLLLNYLTNKYKNFYYVSSTTKVLTNFNDFINELNREEFSFVVPDFRLNKTFNKLSKLSTNQKNKVEFLCNECCYVGCKDREECYKNVSRKNLGLDTNENICKAPNLDCGYSFSKAMKNPSFISIEDINNIYMPLGFNNFKIEGRGLGNALLFEFILYYMTKPEYHINVREMLYLDNMLDLF